MVTLPVLVPVVVGVKVTLMEQFEAGGTLVPHVLLEMAKSPATVIVPISRGAVP